MGKTRVIEIQKTMYVDGEVVHVSDGVQVTDATQLTRGEMKVLTERLGWSIDGQFHVCDHDGNLVLESKLEFF